MDRATQIMAASAVDIMTDKSLIEKAKAKWKELLAERPYECLLPEDHKPPLGINRETMEKYYPDRMKEK